MNVICTLAAKAHTHGDSTYSLVSGGIKNFYVDKMNDKLILPPIELFIRVEVKKHDAGKHLLSIRWIDQDGRSIILDPNGDIVPKHEIALDFGNSGIFTFISLLHGFMVPAYGDYELRVDIDDKNFVEYPFSVGGTRPKQ